MILQLTKKKILELFEEINKKLKKEGLHGDIAVYGGTVMCLVFNARAATDDIDSIFSPLIPMFKIIDEISRENNLKRDWLNNGIVSYISKNDDLIQYNNYSNLTVQTASPRYMLSMKIFSARNGDGFHDKDDAKFLMDYLGLKLKQELVDIFEEYYPPSFLRQRNKLFIEELFID